MVKHVLDRPKVVTNEMLRRAVAIRRKELPREASLALQQRRRAGVTPKRLSQFARVERGQEL